MHQLPTLSWGLNDTVAISMCKSGHNPLKVTEQYHSDKMVMDAGCYSQSSLTAMCDLDHPGHRWTAKCV